MSVKAVMRPNTALEPTQASGFSSGANGNGVARKHVAATPLVIRYWLLAIREVVKIDGLQ
jgi:hypothetical protein